MSNLQTGILRNGVGPFVALEDGLGEIVFKVLILKLLVLFPQGCVHFSLTGLTHTHWNRFIYKLITVIN